MTKQWYAAPILVLVLALTGAACGAGSPKTTSKGAALAAMAEFFVQERDGGRLPEGTEVRAIGIEANNVRTLDVRAEDSARSVKERYCAEYRYLVPAEDFKEHRRVYVAEQINGAWSVSAVNPDGTCEGVS